MKTNFGIILTFVLVLIGCATLRDEDRPHNWWLPEANPYFIDPDTYNNMIKPSIDFIGREMDGKPVILEILPGTSVL